MPHIFALLWTGDIQYAAPCLKQFFLSHFSHCRQIYQSEDVSSTAEQGMVDLGSEEVTYLFFITPVIDLEHHCPICNWYMWTVYFGCGRYFMSKYQGIFARVVIYPGNIMSNMNGLV